MHSRIHHASLQLATCVDSASPSKLAHGVIHLVPPSHMVDSPVLSQLLHMVDLSLVPPLHMVDSPCPSLAHVWIQASSPSLAHGAIHQSLPLLL